MAFELQQYRIWCLPYSFYFEEWKAKGLKIKVNDFIEFDEYIFEKN